MRREDINGMLPSGSAKRRDTIFVIILTALSVIAGAGIFVCYVVSVLSDTFAYEPPLLILAAIVLATILASIISFQRKKYAAGLSLIFLWTLMALVPGKMFIKNREFEDKSTYTFCAKLKNAVPADALLYHYGHQNPLLTFQMKRVLPNLSSPGELHEDLSNHKVIYVIYENSDIADLSCVKEEILVRKKLFQKKTLTLSRFVMKNER